MSAPRIPNSENYWISKGKNGKNVALYTHDDMDGIFSAIVIKNYLIKQNFNIEKIGIVNYQEGWSAIKFDNTLINVAVDFSESDDNIDVYIDHHGIFLEKENRGKAHIKTKTGSAYEGICDQLGIPVDSIVLNSIDMIDSAKYDDYNVDVKNILDFDFTKFKNKLEFSAAFNQLLKRSDYKSFIEVIGNVKDLNPSIYKIYNLFNKLYPANNLDTNSIKKFAKTCGFKVSVNGDKQDEISIIEFLKILNDNGKSDIIKSFEKDFIDDSRIRLLSMEARTRTNENKEYIENQDDFKSKFISKSINNVDKAQLPGYQILGNLVFVPSGTWANALRIRALLEQDLKKESDIIPTIEYEIDNESPIIDELIECIDSEVELIGDINNNKIFVLEKINDKNIEGIKGTLIEKDNKILFLAKKPIMFVMLQYGNTLQIASFKKMEKLVEKYLPVGDDGEKISNLGIYTEKTLNHFIKNHKYDIKTVPDARTTAGGHKGIGSISNIFGEIRNGEYENVRFLDIIKNKIIKDLSGIEWNDLAMCWGDPDEKPRKAKENEIDKRVMKVSDIRIV